MRAALLTLVLALTPACGPWLYAASTPPPGTIARLNTKAEAAVITEGAVLAFECRKSHPCRSAKATSDNPDVADVLPAALARLDPVFAGGMSLQPGMEPAAAFVLIARAPGKTTVRVRSSTGDVDLAVTVLPAK
jgi:hypothetical protein